MPVPRITINSEVEYHQTASGMAWFVDGKLVERHLITPELERRLQQQLERTEREEQDRDARVAAKESEGVPRREAEEQVSDEDWLAGFITLEQGNVEDQLQNAGADMAAPEIQRFILEVANRDIDPTLLQGFVPLLAQTYPGQGATAYQQAVQEAGFGDVFQPAAAPLDEGEIRTGRGHYRPEPSEVGGPRYETSGDWIRFKNGVVVNMAEGAVLYEPGTLVPGSPAWRNEVASKWSDEKAQEWRTKLHQLGYDVAKKGGMAVDLLSALQAYHNSRYLSGGEVLPIAPAGADREEKAKLVNVEEEMGATIRNDVRETYRRIYGTDPTDGEVEAFSSQIFSTAMKLQRQYRGKYGDPNVSTAVQEASERQIERMEGSPQAELLLESEEENTRLRDAMDRAISATRGLAG